MFTKLWWYNVSFKLRNMSLWKYACSYEIDVNVLRMLWQWIINVVVVVVVELWKDFSYIHENMIGIGFSYIKILKSWMVSQLT